ncbi:hypothetical protein BO99DRAFT_450630 [Aspergillus violaceofuscus CBS 115571]|uniref:Uncharacterized protein n=1 Tax=Aspergillus violaceofuscus (strain CBS 115571) TaxID=1450538 RepID=A0A2V5I3R9_ASPV1|nr:hypothetical protein BO99DRAFT_450630 [Aspergillus violaceofuscus CBS 115571]
MSNRENRPHALRRRPLPAVPQILEGIELEEVVDCLPSVHQVLRNRETTDSGLGVVQRSSNRPKQLFPLYQTVDEASVEAFAFNRSPHGQPARTTRLLPPPYGSYYPPRAAPTVTPSTHPLLQQSPASTAGGSSNLTSAPAAPVIVVTDPDGDQRALSTEDEFLYPIPLLGDASAQPGIPLPHVAEEPRGQAYDILEEFRQRDDNPPPPRKSTVQRSRLSPFWQPRPVRTYSSFAGGGYPPDNGMGFASRSLSLSPSPPGIEIVTAFEDQPARTAKCDVCDGRNTFGMSRCTVCKWQCCHDCTIRHGLRRAHICGNVLHVAPTTREELLRSSTETSSRSTGRTKRRKQAKKAGGSGARASAHAHARNNRGLESPVSTSDDGSSVGTATETRYHVETGVFENPHPRASTYQSFVDGDVIVRDFGAVTEAEGTAAEAGANIRTFPKPKQAQQFVSTVHPSYSHECIWGPPPGLDDAFTANAARVYISATPSGRPEYSDQDMEDAGELLTFSTAATAIEDVKRGIYLAAGGIPDEGSIIEDASALTQREIEEYKQSRASETLAGMNPTNQHQGLAKHDAVQVEAEDTVAARTAARPIYFPGSSR